MQILNAREHTFLRKVRWTWFSYISYMSSDHIAKNIRNAMVFPSFFSMLLIGCLKQALKSDWIFCSSTSRVGIGINMISSTIWC